MRKIELAPVYTYTEEELDDEISTWTLIGLMSIGLIAAAIAVVFWQIIDLFKTGGNGLNNGLRFLHRNLLNHPLTRLWHLSIAATIAIPVLATAELIQYTWWVGSIHMLSIIGSVIGFIIWQLLVSMTATYAPTAGAFFAGFMGFQAHSFAEAKCQLTHNRIMSRDMKWALNLWLGIPNLQ